MFIIIQPDYITKSRVLYLMLNKKTEEGITKSN
jgi:hypothetical protein